MRRSLALMVLNEFAFECELIDSRSIDLRRTVEKQRKHGWLVCGQKYVSALHTRKDKAVSDRERFIGQQDMEVLKYDGDGSYAEVTKRKTDFNRNQSRVSLSLPTKIAHSLAEAIWNCPKKQQQTAGLR